MIARGQSLFRRLALIIAAVLLLGAIILTTAAWYYARVAADDAYDRLLLGAALQIADAISVQDGRIGVEPPVAAFETLALARNDRIFYQVRDPTGTILTGDDDLRSTAASSLSKGPVVEDGRYHQVPVRMATVRRLVPEPAGQGWAIVTVAQTRQARSALAEDLTAKASLLVLAMSGLALIAMMIAVRQALAPLRVIDRALRSREPKDLTPLDVEVPREVFVLVTSINHFMERLSRRVGLMNRFIGDAAHQIRTPLTALIAQVDLLSTETNPKRQERQLARVQERATELARLTNQLLSHAMVIHRAESDQFEPIDLVGLARRTLSDAVPLSLDRPVEISFEAKVEQVLIEGDGVSLREALANIIHNALKHGARSRLMVRVSADAERASVEVVDDGPGIPVADWSRVREPFQSGDPAGTGSGLGLSIAVDVVRAHDGELRFREHSGEGFAVVLTFRRLGAGDQTASSILQEP
ncbi:sensor histidine kinase [Microvirga tunisiensis]|uniref:histidine kinase n=1 Tax=Microvirga tunisiensis TaxID=2108360 RepID=A0A5N7MQS8_9HYPH|nr:sensor histidine kinase [Microvirga tunisiensis]MPR11293.1 sensor histidine kinase [Microvirga tunisiensis]MPR29367.1 sensor histidine kinase [Microvirga tunisiensis]